MVKNKKVPTILALVLLVVGVFLGVIFINSKTDFLPRAAPETQPKEIKLVNLQPKNFSVTWLTGAAISGFVKYGTTANKLDFVVQDERDQLSGDVGEFRNHFVTMANLEPNTTYYFRLGSGTQLYDNNGQSFAVTTPADTSGEPASDMIYGVVNNPAGNAANDSIVFASLEGGVTQAALTKDNGNWAINLGKIWNQTTKSYLTYNKDQTAIVITVLDVEGKKTVVNTIGANSRPVPTITLGKDVSLTSANSSPNADNPVGQNDNSNASSENNNASQDNSSSNQVDQSNSNQNESNQQQNSNATSENDSDNSTSKISLEPIDVVENSTSSKITISNFAKDGVIVDDTTPTFKGKAPAGSMITISVHSETAYTDTVTVSNSGSWEWTPPAGLEAGSHTVTLSYMDPKTNKIEVVTRDFVVGSMTVANSDSPTYEATPSASTTPTPKPTATPKPRTSVSTESAVPVAGNATYTLYIMLSALVLISIGFGLTISGKKY